MKYKVSIIMEAYNEENTALAEHPAAVEHLLRQNFPLEKVELVLVGTSSQLADWKVVPARWNRFGRVRVVPLPSTLVGHYWEQKNFGAQVAEGEIVAWVDSDVKAEPTWLRSIVSAIDGGADVSVGPSMYSNDWFQNPHSPLMLAVASISWGFVLSQGSRPGQALPNSLLAHNVGVRREVALRIPFRTDRGSFQSSIFYFDLVQNRVKVAYQPGQRAAHQMTFWWWLSRRHFRSGWETYNGRAAHELWPRIAALERVPWIEPVILRGGMVLRDARHWFRYRRVTGVSAAKAWLILPLVVATSAAARTAEAIGMYSWMLAPRATARQARF